MATSWQVTFDCAGPDRLAHFWGEALHYKPDDPPDGYATWEEFLGAIGVPEEEWDDGASVADPDGVGARIYFQRVPEPKTVKNRLHLDLDVGGGRSTPLEERRRRVEAEVERLVALGASRLRIFEEFDSYHVVMQDPEGNEFCLH